MTASLLPPVVADPHAPLARRNPVAKLGAATVLLVALLATVDPLTPALLLTVELAVLPWSGVTAATLARRAWPLLVAAASLGLANALFAAKQGGRVFLDVGPVLLTETGLAAGGSAVLRLLAIAVPGVLALATTDPVDLADALVQQLRLPARFAYGALAAVRLLPLLGAEWQTIGRARRARGIDAGRNPLAAGRLLASRVLALLVAAIRRGVRLATAMDARGFDAGLDRSFARQQRMRAGDWVLLAAAVAVAAAATGTSLAVGVWRPLLG
jgi:energy-coupling factor transport system permease protein